MVKINILPEIVANQIAAGEVVERPIAVAKELVENSIDAGADHIIVHFSHGGKQLIMVEDNGCGMAEEDALLSFKRHATSKISSIEDIGAIKTFGFRGEALPSIASVSKLTMRTRVSGGDGQEICYNGGKFVHSKAFGMPVGTTIQVEQLFHNVPARRKFLKTDQTEADHIVELIKNFALSEKSIKFELLSDGHKIFQSPLGDSWEDRVSQVFCPNERLLPVSYEHNNCSIDGAIGDPDSGLPCRRFLSFFVNRRPVDSKLLRFAVSDTLSGILPRHREMIACLLLTIDPSFVDVNVHPMKREVRFRNEQFIRECVQNGIVAALHRPQQIKSGDVTRIFMPQRVAASSRPSTQHSLNCGHYSTVPSAVQRTILGRTENFFDEKPRGELGWKFIGKVFDNCALFESATGLIVLNIRLAVRKILFEQLRQNKQENERQGLLLPIDILTDDSEAITVNSLADFLGRKNIEIYQFGKNHYRVSSIPPWLSLNQVEAFIRDMIQASTEYDFKENSGIGEEKFSKIASQHARYEQYATGDDIGTLARELLKCENFSRGPDGETPLFEIAKCDFLKRFPFL
ncbi:MAG: DNA mismatch repair endonuclease MutL [Puniceicoccales bacterium]|nr:DNA mismatch repair endonuclease MutL [Puniceicoccales bacterium]